MNIVAIILACLNVLSTELLTFVGPRDWTFQGKLHIPDTQTGPAVLMIGGGIGNDLEWSVPGSLRIGDEKTQITISGEAHEDAVLIANALVAKGCTVMHYSTISKEDPKRDLYPYELSVVNPLELMELARLSYDVFVTHPAIQGRPIVILGFSMGAQRAVQLASEHEKVSSLVLLSGAQMTATSADDSGRNMQYKTSNSLADPSISLYDFDGDGVVHLWEVSGVLALQARNEAGIENLPTHDSYGMPFGELVLDALKKPTLAIYGSLDNVQSCHAVILSENKLQGEWLDIHVIPEVGHQLGAEEDGKIGPISKEVCDLISTWLLSRMPSNTE